MAVATKIASVGLVRDSAPEVSNEANALRRAEQVVLRSPGVIETRPSFQKAYERVDGDTRRVRALFDYWGSTVIIEEPTGGPGVWTASRGSSVAGLAVISPPTTTTVPGTFEPPDFDACETKFATMRNNLYLSGKYGPLVLEQPDGPARFAGVDMRVTADIVQPLPAVGATLDSSFAYRFVFVRKDANGYVRRSPPSQRYVLLGSSVALAFGTATRVYFPIELQEGDQVEVYRTILTTGLSPRPEHYLAYTYTITYADRALRYFVPPTDTTLDSQLGAQLYTDAANGGAIAAKYAPPKSSILAQWQGRMWYARTDDRRRVGAQLLHVGRGGVPIAVSNPTVQTFTAGSITVYQDTTAGLVVGMLISTNRDYGPAIDSYYIPAGTTIVAIVPGVSFDMSAPALNTTTNHVPVYAFQPDAPHGLIAVGAAQGNVFGDITSGSPIITSIQQIPDDPAAIAAGTANIGTLGWAAGMQVFSTFPFFPPGTKILTVGPGPQIRCDQNAIGSGTHVAFGVADIVSVTQGSTTIEFGARQGTSLTSSLLDGPPGLKPFVADPSGVPVFFISAGPNHALPELGAVGGWQVNLAIQSLCEAINYYSMISAGETFRAGAIPNGDTWNVRTGTPTLDAAGLLATPGTLSTGFTLEEGSVAGERSFDAPLSIDSSNRLAWAPNLPAVAVTANALNRIYFSDPDEPESVPLLNYINVGGQSEPVLALVPLRNAMLVFKSDGLWRVTGGAAAASISVDQLDPSLRLIRPETVAQVDNVAYAWCDRGFFACTETGSQSLSASKLDVELQRYADLVLLNGKSHGAFVVGWRTRNLVLLAVPNLRDQLACALVYAFNTTTGAFSEWPIAWNCACEVRNQYFEPHGGAVYASRAPDGLCVYEVRYGIDSIGVDRSYDLGDTLTTDGVTVTIGASDIGTWNPRVGDWLSATDGTLRVWRRIIAATLNAGTWTLTLEDTLSGGAAGDIITDTGAYIVTDGGVRLRVSDLYGWEATEAITMLLEWHPTSPVGLPIGSMAREIQAQLDLRLAPDPTKDDSIPRYIVGGTSDRNAFATLTSRMTRIPQVQPLRVQVSRQVARTASMAAYFETSDIYAIRVVGLSSVFEGTSERTRR